MSVGKLFLEEVLRTELHNQPVSAWRTNANSGHCILCHEYIQPGTGLFVAPLDRQILPWFWVHEEELAGVGLHAILEPLHQEWLALQHAILHSPFACPAYAEEYLSVRDARAQDRNRR